MQTGKQNIKGNLSLDGIIESHLKMAGNYGIEFDNSGYFLKDYEEGTFTFTGANFISQTCHYIKIGRFCSIFCHLHFQPNQNVGSLSGLPFTSAFGSVGSTMTHNIGWSRSVQISPYIHESDIIVSFYSFGGDATGDWATLLSTGVNPQIHFSVIYKTI